MQTWYASGLQPTRLAHIGQAYYFGPQAMEVDGVSDKVSQLTLLRVARVDIQPAERGMCIGRILGTCRKNPIW